MFELCKCLAVRKVIYLFLQMLWFILGLFIFSLSTVLLLQANLGLGPWDVFHISLAKYLPFTFGQVIIGTGVLCVAASYKMGIKPTYGTILNMFLIGAFIDLITLWGWVPNAGLPYHQYLFFSAGIIGCGLGTGMYISANMGTGPRDSLMMGLHQITGWRIGLVRTIIEVSVVALGFSLGGKIGVGTIIFSFTIGWFAEMFLKIFNWFGKQSWFVLKKSTFIGKNGRAGVSK